MGFDGCASAEIERMNEQQNKEWITTNKAILFVFLLVSILVFLPCLGINNKQELMDGKYIIQSGIIKGVVWEVLIFLVALLCLRPFFADIDEAANRSIEFTDNTLTQRSIFCVLLVLY